jgi:hypothetical protein
MTATSRITPVREALLVQSALAVHVQDGLGAVKDKDKKFIDASIRSQFADSLNTDEAFRAGHDQEPRWDYLLGHASGREKGQLIAIEPHSAKTDEVNAVIKKKSALRHQLQGHLKDGHPICKWLWVASGRNGFPKDSQHIRRLTQHGITFIGSGFVMAKHLP